MIATETRALGVAVVGLGVGEQHARTYAALPSCAAPRLFDLDHAQAARIAATIPGSTVASNYRSILDDRDIDIVSIASFDDAHFEQVTQALATDKHVFVEKPLCRSAAELHTISTLWRKSEGRLRLGCNLVLRAAPAFVWLKCQIETGAFGQIYAIDGDYLYGRMHKITGDWRSKVENYSVMLGGGIHLIDLILWLTGQRPHSVTATGNRICTAGSTFRYDDMIAATLRFQTGMIGRITANFGCVHRHQHVLRVFGTQATFIYDEQGPRVMWTRDPQQAPEALTLATLPANKGALIPGFVAAVAGETDYTSETQTIFDGISIAIACDAAAQTDATVKLEYQ